jgi:hypothetical protein
MQQQQQQQQKGPRTSRGKKRHRWHGKGRGDGAAQPSLAALSAQNRRRAQKHFGNDTPMSEAPRTAPHAPHNDNSFILSQHGRAVGRVDSPAMTPSQPGAEVPWTPSHSFPADYASLNQDAADLGAQLDFFGTNEGLVARYSSEDDSSDAEVNDSEEGEDEQHAWRLRGAAQGGAVSTAAVGLPDHIRARLASQAAYIAQLEAENLDLQEKYSLLQHELEEHKAAARTAAAASTGPAEGRQQPDALAAAAASSPEMPGE